MSYSPLANILKKNFRDLRKFIIRDYNEIEELQSSVKDVNIFTRNAQNKIEKEVHSFLQKIKPQFKIVKEYDDKFDNFWLVSIIDSSLNFTRANENFGINISLFEQNVINSNLFYSPLKDEIFFFMKKLQEPSRMKPESGFQIKTKGRSSYKHF